jgi:hypothetical protein
MEDDPRRFLDYDEPTEEELAAKEASDEAYDNLISYERLTGTMS